MIPQHWEGILNRYAFLATSPRKLDENKQAAEINRQLADYGHSTKKNPIALLFDESASYKWWRFFEYDIEHERLVRLTVPRECNPELFMREHKNFRMPTLDDFMELYSRPDTEAEAAKLDREIKEKRARDKETASADAKDKMMGVLEDAVIDEQSGKNQERLKVPVSLPNEPKPSKALKPKGRTGRTRRRKAVA